MGKHIAICNGFNGSNAIYRTENYRATNPIWTRVDGENQQTNDGPIYCFAQNPNNPNEVLALRNSPKHGTRISVSKDAGANWIQTEGINKHPSVRNAFKWRDVNNGQIGLFGTNTIDKIIFSRAVFHPQSNSQNHPKPLIIGLSSNHIYCTDLSKKFSYQHATWLNILSYMHLPGHVFVDIIEDPKHDGWFWVQTNTGIFYLHLYETAGFKKHVNALGMDTFLLQNGIANEIYTNLDPAHGLSARNPQLGITKIINAKMSVDNKNDLYISYRVIAKNVTHDIIEHIKIDIDFHEKVPIIKKAFYMIAQNINANPTLPSAHRGEYVFNPADPRFIYYEDPYSRQMNELKLNNLQGLSSSINVRGIASDCHQDVRTIVLRNTPRDTASDFTTELFIGNDGGISFSANIEAINLTSINGIGLNINRFWNVGVSQNLPDYILGGAQDGNHYIFNNNVPSLYRPGYGDGFKAIFNPFQQLNKDNIDNPPVFFNSNEYIGSMNPHSSSFVSSGPNNFSRIPYILSSKSKRESLQLICTDAGYNGFQNIHRVLYNPISNTSSISLLGNYPNGQSSIEINHIDPGNGSSIKQMRVHTGHINGLVESKLDSNTYYFTRASTIWYNNDHLEQVGGVYCLKGTSVNDLTGSLMEDSVLHQMNSLSASTPLSDGASVNCVETGIGHVFGFGPMKEIVFIGLSAGVLGANVFFCYPDNNIQWRNISEGLGAGISINCLKYDQVNGILYAGTNEGLYKINFRKLNPFSSWGKINSIPNIPIMDLDIQTTQGILYAASFGGGMFKASLKGYSTLPQQK
ncbi:MAG: hypothetical protein IPK03_05790 [Bacteroidetes bacterium]|nr:hypothetical protein [Bacteroidota bacterium]